MHKTHERKITHTLPQGEEVYPIAENHIHHPTTSVSFLSLIHHHHRHQQHLWFIIITSSLASLIHCCKLVFLILSNQHLYIQHTTFYYTFKTKSWTNWSSLILEDNICIVYTFFILISWVVVVGSSSNAEWPINPSKIFCIGILRE
jgi:hypothetical protein